MDHATEGFVLLAGMILLLAANVYVLFRKDVPAAARMGFCIGAFYGSSLVLILAGKMISDLMS